ncbi:hypothetical protein J4467_02940 [Candidatus Woesearchaeota archaeon]|nr:hypothetical protein [Candidatus Woesearchaeota archaeon]
MGKNIQKRSKFGEQFTFRGPDRNGDATDIFSNDSSSLISNLAGSNDDDPIPMDETPGLEQEGEFNVSVQEGSVIETPFIDIYAPDILPAPVVPSGPVVIPRRSLMPALGLVAASTLLCAGYLIFPFDNSTSVTTTPVTTYTISHDTPEILLPPTKEVGIFEYTGGELLIHTQPEFGISSYAATISGTDITELLSMTPEDQLSLVSRFDSDLRTYTKSSLTPVLDFTIAIIGDNSVVERPDTTYVGLRNPKRNVIHSGTTLTVPVAFSPESADLEDIVDSQGSVELPGLGKVIQEYFEFNQIQRDIPSVRDDAFMNDVARNIGLQYNSSKVEGTQNMFDLSLYSKEDRIDLASRLYREASDRKSKSYMTTEEILELVNFGADDRIQYNQMQQDFSRNDLNQRRIQERRQNLLQDTLELGYANLGRKEILNLAKKYGVSETTIRRDLKQSPLEVPEPYHLQNAQISA